MTKVTREDVHHLAQLSSLQLDEQEADNLQQDLEAIIRHIDQLGELDTSGIEPTYQVTGLQNVWRDDTVEPHPVDRDILLDLAPETENYQIKVPKVL